MSHGGLDHCPSPHEILFMADCMCGMQKKEQDLEDNVQQLDAALDDLLQLEAEQQARQAQWEASFVQRQREYDDQEALQSTRQATFAQMESDLTEREAVLKCKETELTSGWAQLRCHQHHLATALSELAQTQPHVPKMAQPVQYSQLETHQSHFTQQAAGRSTLVSEGLPSVPDHLTDFDQHMARLDLSASGQDSGNLLLTRDLQSECMSVEIALLEQQYLLHA